MCQARGTRLILPAPLRAKAPPVFRWPKIEGATRRPNLYSVLGDSSVPCSHGDSQMTHLTIYPLLPSLLLTSLGGKPTAGGTQWYAHQCIARLTRGHENPHESPRNPSLSCAAQVPTTAQLATKSATRASNHGSAVVRGGTQWYAHQCIACPTWHKSQPRRDRGTTLR
jgi:hypothetical protein